MERQPTFGPVLIVGGGIAGPALAIALRRAEIDSIVYESSPEPRDEAGAFLNLAPNGLNVLRELGVENRTERLGFRNERLVFHSDTGRLLADAPVGGITLMRGALSPCFGRLPSTPASGSSSARSWIATLRPASRASPLGDHIPRPPRRCRSLSRGWCRRRAGQRTEQVDRHALVRSSTAMVRWYGDSYSAPG